jgi:hypothetical protein
MTEKPGKQAGILCALMIHKTEEDLRGVEKEITEGEEGSMSFLPSQFKMFSVISSMLKSKSQFRDSMFFRTIL